MRTMLFIHKLFMPAHTRRHHPVSCPCSIPLANAQAREGATRIAMLAMTALSFLAHPAAGFAQQDRIGILTAELHRMKQDSNRVNTLLALSFDYRVVDGHKALRHGEAALKLARKLSFQRGIARAHTTLGAVYQNLGDKEMTRFHHEQALKLGSKHRECATMSMAFRGLGILEKRMGNSEKAMYYYQEALKVSESARNRLETMKTVNNLANIYWDRGDLEKALTSYELCRTASEELGDAAGLPTVLMNMGMIHAEKGDTAKAMSYLERGLAISDSLGDKRSQLEVLNNIGTFHLQKGKYSKAFDIFQRNLKIAEESGFQSKVSVAANNIAAVLRAKGDPASAIVYLERSVAIAEKQGEKEGVAIGLYNLGDIRMEMNDCEAARSYFLQCLALFEKLQKERDCADVLFQIGRTYSPGGSYNEALDYLTRSLALSERLKYNSATRKTLNEIGIIHKKRGEYAEALRCYKRSLALSEAEKDKLSIAGVLINMGAAYGNIGDRVNALHYYQKGLKISEEIGHTPWIINALYHIGNVQDANGNDSLALAYFRRSLALSVKTGNTQGMAMNFICIGSISGSRGDHADAVQYFEQAFRIYESLQDEAGMTRSQEDIATTEALRGNFDAALSAYMRSLKMFERRGSKGYSGTLRNIGQIYFEKREYDTAQLYFDSSLALARETGQLGNVRNSLGSLAVLFARKGDYAKAYEYQKEYQAASDSLLNETNMKHMNEMTAKYESDQKEQHIALLEKDKVLHASELERQQRELALRNLDAIRSRQQMELLAKRNQLTGLALAHSTTELKLKTTEAELQRTENEKRSREVGFLTEKTTLQASLLAQERTVRNTLIAGVGLLLVVAFLIGKRIQDARRGESLALVSAYERARKEEMEEFAHRLIQLQEQERSRLARELHDHLGQELLVIKNQAHLALQKSSRVEEIEERLLRVKGLALTMLDEIKQMSRNLRPVQLERSGLSSTIREMLQQLEQSSTIAIDAVIHEIDGLFGKDDEINVYRILQESMNNVLKHSEATHVNVAVHRGQDLVVVRVEDNGRGFDRDRVHGFGLQGMQERVLILRGRMEIDAAPGRGTRIEVQLPVHAEAA